MHSTRCTRAPPDPGNIRSRPGPGGRGIAPLDLAGRMGYEPATMKDTDILPVLGAMVLMLLGGKLGGSLVGRLGQSPVLGELAAGIVIGNLGLLGIHGLDSLRGPAGLDLLAPIGVLFLLFSVGLQSAVKQVMAAGASSFVLAGPGGIAAAGPG